jgi:hypothetical protein
MSDLHFAVPPSAACVQVQPIEGRCHGSRFEVAWRGDAGLYGAARSGLPQRARDTSTVPDDLDRIRRLAGESIAR